ncbi:hypothetical protein TWF696_002250 [Orbilia brochopaga]|uniref:LEM domain-containing protein n=1 Tax=Orbilia brochopaga TaxID=3140254 RepID=A0AAV9U4M9_9PEZI
MDATSIKIKAVSRPSNLSRKVITPKPLNLKPSSVKIKKKGGAQHYSLQDENFDPRPFSFLENNPVTPGFEPITPFEMTPPNSDGGAEDEDEIEDDIDDDNDSIIIDSPGPTADFHNNNRMRKALKKYDEDIDTEEDERLRHEEAEYVARNLGFSQSQPVTSSVRGLLLKKANKKASRQSSKYRESRETVFSEDSAFSEESNSTARGKSRFSVTTAADTEFDPTTPFMDTGFDDYYDNSKTPQANTSRNLLLRGAPPASATRAKFVTTELVMPMPQHPTPLSPTMERFLSRMSEVISSPMSTSFPEEAQSIDYQLDSIAPLPPKQDFKIPSHVIDVNLVSVVAMDFSPQPMIDITANAPLVQQECDPISEPKQSTSNVQQIMYIIPILLNDPASFCACDKAHVDSDTASLASVSRSALHPNNLLRFENVVVQMRLAPRPRIRRHGWTFLNIGIPTRIVVGILDHLEKELISVGKCKMVLHGDYYWIYTPVRAFTKIYKRESLNSPTNGPSRSNSKTPKTAADLNNIDEEDEDNDSVIDDSDDETPEDEEESQTVYTELPDSRFYSLLETRSLSVDLYTEIYAKSTAEYPMDSASQGDFSLGFSIREIIVTAESNVRGPDWHHVKSQRTKCLARGHAGETISPISGLNRSVVGSPFNPGSVNAQAINQWNNNVTAGSVRSASNLGNPVDRWDPNATPVNRDPNATPIARSVANGSVVNGHDYASMTRYGSRGATATPGACSHCGSQVGNDYGSPSSSSSALGVSPSPHHTHGWAEKRSGSSATYRSQSQGLNRIREDGRQSSRGHRMADVDSQSNRSQSRNRDIEPRSGSKVRSASQLSHRNKDGRSSAQRRREDRSQSRDRTIERDAASTPRMPQTTSTTYDSENWNTRDMARPRMEESSPEKSRKRWGRKKKKYVDN